MDSWRFDILSLSERGELVFEHSEFLLSTISHALRSSLYSYENLFIEVKMGHDSGEVDSIEVIPVEEMSRFVDDIKLPFT